jgi:hypothetical protein
MKEEKVILWGMLTAYVAIVLGILAFWATVVVVITHFIHKLW